MPAVLIFSLSYIVTKLVNNTCKYMQAEGIITVLARVEKSAFSISSLVVKVSNTGV
jgi:signal transduction histidine kinase